MSRILQHTVILTSSVSTMLLVAGCGYGPAAQPRGVQPIPYADTLPIPEPEESDVVEMAVVLDEAVPGEVGEAVDVKELIDGPPPALNVTAFDDVVPSSWFEPRMGRAPLSPAELARGPGGSDPASSGPLTVVAAKTEGVSPGLTVMDEADNRYLLKLDLPAHPAMASGAEVVTSRLFWGLGYHVPRNVVMRFDPDRLVLGDEATIETDLDERAMRTEDIDSLLKMAKPGPDGRYRALASLFVPGTPKGKWRFENTRDDDPNDYYPHEHRRELRGMWVVAAWLNHVDLQARNTLDSYIGPTGYLRHYVIDFGTSLGSGTIRALHPREGLEYAFDLGPFLARMATLGLYRVGWEYESQEPIHPSIGLLAVEEYDPAEWKPFWPNEARNRLAAPDGYWAAKLIATFTEEHLRAVVDEARYPDPAAADTLVDILLLRQERTVREWYSRVTPVEEVEVEARSADELVVSFRDLELEEGFADPATTGYVWEFEHEALDREVEGESAARAGRQQITIRWEEPGEAAVPAGDAALATLEISSVRSGGERREAVVTLRLEPDGSYRVVGLAH